MKLYDLAQNYAQLLEMAEEMESDALVDTLQSLEDAIEEKVENIAKLIRNLEADAKIIKEEEQRLAERRRAIEAKVDKLKTYLQEQLETAGLQKVKRPTITVAIQVNPPSVDVIDETAIPSDFLIPQPSKLDKKSILERLKNGEAIPGVTLKQTKGVRIR
ncbi:siphovirus Gp157 family protein [Anoxybacillus kestanbolensis]|uniref:siphovirus Gp157 family protein n=1 Tax=Anoxybacillus kestanbolensis TaxID=227476 RepID=UPI00208DAAEF|nr:siphovirus Gp157 family protein [Anoxybacillus kestanbolensis]MCL9971570.1 siphovirus Gp157 family protein [Anoxybacillus kestanbolensis]